MALVDNRFRWIGCGVLLCVSVAMACKYTIRDVGFVQLQKAVYRIYCYEQAPTVGFDACSRALADTNVALEQVDATATPDHPALKYRENRNSRAVLRTPDGRLLALDGASEDGLLRVVEGVVRSPLRDALLKDMAKRYAAVLVIPGTDKKSAASADAMVKTVVEEIFNGLESLPKPVALPPLVVRLTEAQVKEEALTLWILGVAAEPKRETQIVILMGRLRKFGEVMSVPGMDLGHLRTVLGYVGQDCECSLDRRWMDGLTLPHKWGMNHQIAALKGLGFDPGNPLVQTEISQILSKPRTAPDETGGEAYGEISLSLDGGDLVQQSEADKVAESANSEPTAAAEAVMIPEEPIAAGRYMIVVVLVILGLTMVVGCGVLMMRRRG